MGLGGVGAGVVREFDRADGSVVEVVHPGEVGFVGEDPVFPAVIEAVDVFADEAVEVWLD